MVGNCGKVTWGQLVEGPECRDTELRVNSVCAWEPLIVTTGKKDVSNITEQEVVDPVTIWGCENEDREAPWPEESKKGHILKAGM